MSETTTLPAVPAPGPTPTAPAAPPAAAAPEAGPSTSARPPALARVFDQAMRENRSAPTSQPVVQPAPAEPVVPDGHVQLEIPPALQARFGKDRIVRAEDAEFFRGALSPTRTSDSELAALTAETQRLRADIAAARQQALDFEAIPAAIEKFKTTEEYRDLATKLAQLEENERDGFLSEGTAARFREHVLGDAEQTFVRAEQTRAREEARAVQQHQAAESWVADSWRRTMADLPPEITSRIRNFDQLFHEEVDSFNHRLTNPAYKPEMRGGEATYVEFRRLLLQRLANEPHVGPLVVAHEKARRRATTPTRDTSGRFVPAEKNPLGNPPTTASRSPTPRPKMSAVEYDRFMRRR